ncbi:MAG: hypothetical protein JXR07_14490 [Reichenbachiella sp.]
MGLISSIFNKKPKPQIAQCSVCKSHMESDEGFALTTSQVVISKKYWDHKMVEPETLSYTTQHFKAKDINATNMRRIIFEKTAEKDMTWITCETCIKHFDVCQDASKELANQWWSEGKGHRIPNTGKATDYLSANEYEQIKEYATMDAGSSLIRI